MGRVGIRGLPSKKSTDRSVEGVLNMASPREHFWEADKSLKNSAQAGGGTWVWRRQRHRVGVRETAIQDNFPWRRLHHRVRGRDDSG